jgi:serine/threonine-protein kinase
MAGADPALGSASTWQSADPALPGQRLGPWCLQHKLGAGGMGEVWLARRADGLYEAEVAIKLLRVSGPGLAQRFARERALLARLQHPGIARLLDAGQETGRAYLVLEHVPGQTLDRHARAHAQSVAQRVELLLAVARAVAHAHAQLVLHRDLKPGNVIVTPEGQAKLLDFGVAALLEEVGTDTAEQSELTQLVGRAHTPAYAAPEHIAGEPCGVAADVYSLGVMLFELLCGELPYQHAASRQALEHAVLHTEARRLGELLDAPGPARPRGPGRPLDARRARGDLAAVAARALRKKPEQRYESVQALIADLEAWQQHRPVSARRGQWRHATGLWLRRHALLAGAGTLVLASLGLGLGASLWQWQRAEAEARRSRAAVDYLGDLLSSANPNEHGGKPPTVLDLLEKSRRELDQRFAADPQLQAELQGVLAHVYHAQGRMDQAMALGERRLAQLERLWPASHPQRLEAQDDLARIYNAMGLTDRMVALVEPMLEPGRRLWGEASREYSALLQMLFMGYVRLGRFESAEALTPRMLAVNDRVTQAGSMARVAPLNKIAILRFSQGRYAEAQRVLEQARPFWDAGLRKDPVEVLAQWRGLLTMQMRRLQPDMQAPVRRLCAEMDRLLGADSETALGLRMELALWWQERGEMAAALSEREAVWAAMQARQVSAPVLLLPRRAQLLLGRTLAGSAPEAELRAELQRLAQALPGEPRLSGPNLAEPLLQLARAAMALDPALARRLADQLQALPVLAEHAPLRARLAQLQGQLARQAGDLALSRQRLAERLAWLEAVGEPQQAVHWRAQLDLATTLVLQGAPEAAAALARADALRPQGLARQPVLDDWRERLGQGRAQGAPDAQLL